MAACNRWLSSRMTRLALAAVAATQIMPTGMKIASMVIRNISPRLPLSCPSGADGMLRKNTADPRSQMADRAMAMISIPEMPSERGRS